MEDASVTASVKKLSRFRIKELKDVLSSFKLPKQGKKQDLVERIKTALSGEQAGKISTKKSTPSKEEIVKLIEDTFRKMQGEDANDLTTVVHSVSDKDNNSLQNSNELACDPLGSDLKIRCLCENSSSTESMIKQKHSCGQNHSCNFNMQLHECDDKKCGTWQHLRCVIIPDQPGTGVPHPPEIYYCEICRLSRADPFVVSLAHPLNPVKLALKNASVDGSDNVLHVEKSFRLTRKDKDLMSKQDYDVQAWCMLVNDKVMYRMQWPKHASLRVNEFQVRATNRPGQQLLGSNGRDDGPIITPFTRDGLNKISLEARDNRTFCFGVRLVKRHSLLEVRNFVLEESDGESIVEALARVRRCIGGGTPEEETDSDNELVVAESHVINLRCPMSGSRIKVAGRFRPCVHLGGFDLEVFLEINQRSRKWQCPICLKNYSLENIIVDPYFNRITSMMQNCSDDITDVEIKPDGCWRAKAKNESARRSAGDLVCWHFSNGSRCNVSEGGGSEPREKPCLVNQEAFSGIATGQKHQVYDLNSREDIYTILKSENEGKPVGCALEDGPMSISGSGKDRADEYGTTDYNNDGIEYDSVSLNSDLVDNNRISNVEVIELSDSDDDEIMIVTDAANNNCRSLSQTDFNLPVSDTIPNVFEVPDWGLHFESEADCNTGFFNSGGTVSAFGAHIQHIDMEGPSFTNDDIAPATTDDKVISSDTINSYSGVDRSIQMHLPHSPMSTNVNVSMDYDVRDQMNVSNGNQSEDWISPRFGDNQSENNKATATSIDSHIANQILPEKTDLDPMDDHATLLLGLKDAASDKAIRPRSDLSFSCPKQNRSVRRRTYFSVDSD